MATWSLFSSTLKPFPISAVLLGGRRWVVRLTEWVNIPISDGANVTALSCLNYPSRVARQENPESYVQARINSTETVLRVGAVG